MCLILSSRVVFSIPIEPKGFLRITLQNSLKLCETPWNSAKLCETLRNSAKLRETPRNSANLCESLWNSTKLHKTLEKSSIHRIFWPHEGGHKFYTFWHKLFQCGEHSNIPFAIKNAHTRDMNHVGQLKRIN